mgnify:CR=1 FL=1
MKRHGRLFVSLLCAFCVASMPVTCAWAECATQSDSNLLSVEKSTETFADTAVLTEGTALGNLANGGTCVAGGGYVFYVRNGDIWRMAPALGTLASGPRTVRVFGTSVIETAGSIMPGAIREFIAVIYLVSRPPVW